MEQVPVELWEKIARYACVDGGKTGNALSLVSRFMLHLRERHDTSMEGNVENDHQEKLEHRMQYSGDAFIGHPYALC